METKRLFVFYEVNEYISNKYGEISRRSTGISHSPYKVVADMLKKYRISRSYYETRLESRDLNAKVKVKQHDLWYSHEASINFTIYWHPGLDSGAFHIFKFSTRIAEFMPPESFEITHKLIDQDKYCISLSRWDTDLQDMLGNEIIFLPVLAITAMRDNQHALWDRGKAKGRKLEL